MQGPVADQALARRLERAEGLWTACYGARVVGEAEALREWPDGAVASYAGPEAPFFLYGAYAWGLSGPVDDGAWGELLAFYRERRVGVRIEACPLADASLLERARRSGLAVVSANNALYMSRGDARVALSSMPRSIETFEVEDDQRELWALTATRAFAGDESLSAPDALWSVMKDRARTRLFLAAIDGEVAGVGALGVIDGVGKLGGMATLPRFRRRGVQAALVGARVRKALDLDCDLVGADSLPGGASQHNLERLGFRVAYSRLRLVER